MRMGKLVVTLAFVAVVALISALPAWAADLTGQWKAEFDTQVGVQKYTFDLKVEGEKVTGTASFERMGQTGQVTLKEGLLKGDELSFVEPFAFEDNEMRIEYKGKVAGDEIKLTRTVGDIATEELVAKRVKN
jgi:hypothetical protein